MAEDVATLDQIARPTVAQFVAAVEEVWNLLHLKPGEWVQIGDTGQAAVFVELVEAAPYEAAR